MDFVKNEIMLKLKNIVISMVPPNVIKDIDINKDYSDSDVELLSFEFGFDSLDKCEFILGIEENFNIYVDDEEAIQWKKVIDIVDYIEQKSKESNTKRYDEYNKYMEKLMIFNEYFFEKDNNIKHKIFNEKILPLYHNMNKEDVLNDLNKMKEVLDTSSFTDKMKVDIYEQIHEYLSSVYSNKQTRSVKAIVTTSANPFHYGHLDIYNKAKDIFHDVKVIIAQNSDKAKSVDLKSHMDCYNIPYEIIKDKTIADYCKENDITHIVRGIRNGVDAEYELKMDYVNHELNPDVQTIFIPTSDTYSNISSSTIRELIKYKKYDVVKKFMREDAMKKYIEEIEK